MRVKIRAINGYGYQALIKWLKKNNEVIYIEAPKRLFVSAELTAKQISSLERSRSFRISEDEQFDPD